MGFRWLDSVLQDLLCEVYERGSKVSGFGGFKRFQVWVVGVFAERLWDLYHGCEGNVSLYQPL